MPKLTKSVPKYRCHKASGQAVVSLLGKDHYLGLWQSKASKVEYDRLISEWLAAGRPEYRSTVPNDLAIVELLAGYWSFAQKHYRKNGQLTGSIHGIKAAISLVREIYGSSLVIEFGPTALKALQLKMIERGKSRRYVNDHTARIKRIFKWAVSEELIPVTIFQSLQTVPGLQKGRSDAKELPPVQPVSDEVIEKTLAYLPEVVADMVRVQRYTACRPAEVRIIRPCDIDMSRTIWCYRPDSHKTEHHGHERAIFLGPKARSLLARYLLREQECYCFSPIDSERNRLRTRHQQRQTPSSCGNRPGSNRKSERNRSPGSLYSREGYRRAIQRACDKAGVERWSPNRLRHTAATKIRKLYGIEAAQVVLGHSRADVTQVYAERDFKKAAEVMELIG